MTAGNNTRSCFPVLVLLAMVMVIFSSSPLWADIYMYVDKDGVVHFTNAPTASENDYRVYVKEKTVYSAQVYSSDSFEECIRQASVRYNISHPLLKAVIKAESDFNPRARSKKGAMGLMQIMPANIKAMNISNPFDPLENILGGARYLREMLDRFDGHLPLSLAAYNAGPTAVERYNNQVPPYKETEEYVKRVLKFYSSYQY
ncbi:MAG: lytic transglycosylase domain-containing protein [Desulfobacterales bacterium]